MGKFEVIVVAAIFAAGSGCLNFDELSGSAPSDASIDGASTAAPDATTISDGGSTVKIADGSICDDPPDGSIYCEDFDEADANAAMLGATTIATTVVIDDSEFSSPPRALHCSHAQIDAGTVQGYANVSTNVAAKTIVASLDFFAEPGGLPSAATAPLVIFVIGNDTASLQLSASSSVLKITEYDNATNTAHPHAVHSFDLADAKWHHVTLGLDQTTKPATIQLSVDAVVSAADPSLITWTPSVVFLIYGIFTTFGAQAPVDLHFDNVSAVGH